MTAAPELARQPHKHCPECGNELDGSGPVCNSCKIAEYDATSDAMKDYHEPEPEIDHEAEHAPEHAAEPEG